MSCWATLEQNYIESCMSDCISSRKGNCCWLNFTLIIYVHKTFKCRKWEVCDTVFVAEWFVAAKNSDLSYVHAQEIRHSAMLWENIEYCIAVLNKIFEWIGVNLSKSPTNQVTQSSATIADSRAVVIGGGSITNYLSIRGTLFP